MSNKEKKNKSIKKELYKVERKAYHHLPLEEVFKELKTSRSGLTEEEAARRLERFGENRLPEERGASGIIIFLRQFVHPLIYILFAAALISGLTLHFVELGVILFTILATAILGFIQENKANRALAQLKQMVQYKAKVLRDGVEKIIPMEQVVPGDVVLLEPGHKVPADGRLFEVHNLEVVEAALTGESLPSTKNTSIQEKDTSIADRRNMVYLGTVVSRGKGWAVVCQTGADTEVGHIATMVKETEAMESPLKKQIHHFLKFLGLIIVSLNAVLFVLGWLTGQPFYELLITSMALIVSAVPEALLPATASILAIGMIRLAKHKGLVRRMLAAETLGSVSVICSDKTGTLTQGEMRVSHIVTERGVFRHDTEKSLNTLEADIETGYLTALKIGQLCNDVVVENPEEELEEWIIIGDPTEKALFLAATQAGLEKASLEKKEPRLAEIPFDNEHKYMATLRRPMEKEGRFVIYVKGAPERLLAMSSFVDAEGGPEALNDERTKIIQKQWDDFAGKGLRVLAVAYKNVDSVEGISDLSHKDLVNLIFAGLIALKDPLRHEAKEAIKICREAGVRAIMITGDHKRTATAIARELDLDVGEGRVLTGTELEVLSDDELFHRVKDINVYARVEPKHKLRIVRAWQKHGEIVAMTGDGVNDAPALKAADIGVALGAGTDVAKETSDLVLLDNNFSTIVEAVRRGRIIFNNIRKVILLLLTTCLTEVVLIASAIILRFPLPLLPVQILWINIFKDTVPAVAMAFDDFDEGAMKRPPRKRGEALINNPLKGFLAFYIVLMDSAHFALFYFFLKTTGDVAYSRAVVFANVVVASLIYVFSVRGIYTPVWRINQIANWLVPVGVGGVILGLFATLYVPPIQRIFGTVPLNLKTWAIISGYAFISITLYECGKRLFLIRERRRARFKRVEIITQKEGLRWAAPGTVVAIVIPSLILLGTAGSLTLLTLKEASQSVISLKQQLYSESPEEVALAKASLRKLGRKAIAPLIEEIHLLHKDTGWDMRHWVSYYNCVDILVDILKVYPTSGLDLSGINLSGRDLRGMNIPEATLTWANFSGADLSGVDLTDANLLGANLSGANLRKANLTGANLTEADLSNANLTETKLSTVKGLRFVKSFQGTIFSKAKGLSQEDLQYVMSLGAVINK